MPRRSDPIGRIFSAVGVVQSGKPARPEPAPWGRKTVASEFIRSTRPGRVGLALLVSLALCLLLPGPILADATESDDTTESADATESADTDQAAGESSNDALHRHRNLGKAFYENPATQYEAVGEWEKALALAPHSVRDRVNYGMALLRAGQVEEGIAQLEKVQAQDPDLPHTWFNLGVAYNRQSEYKKALRQFEGMVERVADEPISHYNLGVLYKLEGRTDDAIRHFERAAALDPNLAGPHFQLATAYRQAQRPDDAKQAMATFREIKTRNADADVTEDLEWSWYAELYDPLDPAEARPAGDPAPVAFEPVTLVEPGATALAALDLAGDRRVDLAVATADGVHFFREGREKVATLEVSGVTAIEPGDLDNDGLVDLALLVAGRPKLYRQAEGQSENPFAPFEAQPFSGDSGGDAAFRSIVLVDYDHDYDLDLLLLGKTSKLLRRQADGTWLDRTADFPFVDGEAVVGTVFDAVADSQGADVAVGYADRPIVIYRDRLAGRYTAEPIADSLDAGTTAGANAIVAHDVDHDGWTDLTFAGAEGVTVLLNEQGADFQHVGFAPVAKVRGARGPIAWADLGRRGTSDLVAGTRVHRHRGFGKITLGEEPAGWPKDAAAVARADFDADGKVDLAVVTAGGEVRRLDNRTPDGAGGRWIGVALEGTKNLQLAPGAEVEVKAGALYQKKLYRGEPLFFGLGEHATVDTVRITWPNGLIQNETDQPAGVVHSYVEAQRLSGSCPMIYTWNGEEFEFITDVLGVAPLGASAGDGEYFPLDHDEYIQIAGDSLVERDGFYEVRIVEELREVAFLDEIRLVAIDRPASVEIFTNDKFKSPPFPEFRLFGVDAGAGESSGGHSGGRVAPIAARDHRGNDVLARVLEKDATYADGFERRRDGTAEPHFLELDFGDAAPDGRAILVLSGWVDWADASTFLGTSQGSTGLVMPSLQVRDEAGEWRTVIEDMGIPAGKPKTIVVDLTDRFLSDSREVRISTNLCVFWDRIFLAEDPSPPEVRLGELHAARADLRFGGFSKVVVHPERAQPERFVYAEKLSLDRWPWNPTPGLYTRYGDVRPLLDEIDDRFVVMGSGDELRLLFDASALPEVPAGFARDFLLFVDGWAKDGDANTAHSQTVGPLPFHAMPQYPYESPHAYPESDEHTLYREHYLVRPALRLVRPLVPATRESLGGRVGEEAER